MAVIDQPPRNVSTAAAAATAFPYDFKILAAGDLEVRVDGVVKTLGVDYTVSGVASDAGGMVTLLAPLVGGETVTRRRVMAFARATDFQELGDLRSSTLNNDQDAPIMMLQQLGDDVERSLHVSADSVGVSTELPAPVALRPLVWNVAGTALENGDTTLTGDLLLRGHLASTLAGYGARLVAFLQTGTGAVARWVFDKLREHKSAFDFMTEAQITDVVARTYLLDVTEPLRAAGLAVTAAGGGELVLPAGGYKITGTLQYTGDKLRLRGRGRKATVIRQFTPASPSVRIDGGQCEVEGLTIEYATPGTVGGIGIYSIGSYNSVSNVEITDPDTGIYHTAGVAFRARDFTVGNATRTGLALEGMNDAFVRDFVITGAAGAANGILLIGAIEALCCSAGDVIGFVNPLNVSAPAFVLGNRLNPSFNRFTDVFFDSGTESARIYRMVDTDFTGCWFSGGRSGAGFPGFDVIESHNIRFTGGQAFACGSHGGITRASSKFITFANFNASNNGSTAAPNTVSGLAFDAGVTDFSIIGGVATSNIPGSQQGYGVAVVAGASDRYVIQGVNVSGNTVAGISDGGTGTNKKISGNPGYTLPVTAINAAGAPAFANAWANVGGGSEVAGFYKDADGRVWLRGRIGGGTLGLSAFTLPAGFRPRATISFACVSNNAFGWAYIPSTGEVIPQSGSNVYMNLDGISFLADA